MARKIFDKLGFRQPKKSAFDLSREQKTTFNIGELVPTYLEEVVPGDHFRVNTESLARMPALLAPLMHRVDMTMHYFFVPNRLVWSEWEDFITGGQQGTTNPVFPEIQLDEGVQVGDLADYLGLPLVDGSTAGSVLKVSALPFWAYYLIYNEYYRDPNLHPEHTLDTNYLNNKSIKYRAWEKDYFTSALPWTQRGPDVGVLADVGVGPGSQGTKVTRDATGQPAVGLGFDEVITDQDGEMMQIGGEYIRLRDFDDIRVSINELRKSSALQRWLEKSARGGHRYVEQLLVHFGVKSDDARLQRPEYLGGGKQPIVISEVLNTSNTEEHPQGDMTGHAISAGSTNSFTKHFNEHGYVMGIMSVQPKPSYSQGVHRHWTRRDKLDYYFPEFANLGEQEIMKQEIYWDPMAHQDQKKEAWGYQQRYAEYKYGQSTVHGQFRTELDFWHMSRKFNNMPTLNTQFMEINPTEYAQRLFAVDDEPQLMVQLYHKVKARRPMPFFSDPRL